MPDGRRTRGRDRTAGDPPEAGGRLGSGVRLVGPPALVFVVLAALWQAAVVAFGVPTLVLPSPVEVGVAIVEGRATLLSDAAITGATAAAGLLGACVVGVTLAFAMTQSRTTAKVVLPYVISLRIAPLIAIAPLVFLWFGRGIPARSFLVGVLGLFPLTIATLDGLRTTPRRYLRLMDSVAASDRKVFLRVRVPAAAPSIVAGLKLAATLSVIGAVVTEFVTFDGGLGYRVLVTAERLQTPQTFAALVVLSAVGILFYVVPIVLESWLGVR